MIFRRIPVLFNLIIELPFFCVRTSMMHESLERFMFELLVFDVRIFKWRFSFRFTIDWKYWKERWINKKLKKQGEVK